MEELIGQARGVTAEGFTYYFPAAHGSGYPASYLRDFCYMVEAAAEFIPADHVGGTIDFFMSHITADYPPSRGACMAVLNTTYF